MGREIFLFSNKKFEIDMESWQLQIQWRLLGSLLAIIAAFFFFFYNPGVRSTRGPQGVFDASHKGAFPEGVEDDD